jgi:hypothetical protein
MIRCAGRYAMGFSRWLSRYDFKVHTWDILKMWYYEPKVVGSGESTNDMSLIPTSTTTMLSLQHRQFHHVPTLLTRRQPAPSTNIEKKLALGLCSHRLL